MGILIEYHAIISCRTAGMDFQLLSTSRFHYTDAYMWPVHIWVPLYRCIDVADAHRVLLYRCIDVADTHLGPILQMHRCGACSPDNVEEHLG